MARIQNWKPEDPVFWREQGSVLAWRTCGVTTFSLIFSFATWFVMSAVVVRMPAIGFKFTTSELFWLAAIPGLASGILRLIHAIENVEATVAPLQAAAASDAEFAAALLSGSSSAVHLRPWAASREMRPASGGCAFPRQPLAVRR